MLGRMRMQGLQAASIDEPIDTEKIRYPNPAPSVTRVRLKTTWARPWMFFIGLGAALWFAFWFWLIADPTSPIRQPDPPSVVVKHYDPSSELLEPFVVVTNDFTIVGTTTGVSCSHSGKHWAARRVGTDFVCQMEDRPK